MITLFYEIIFFKLSYFLFKVSISRYIKYLRRSFKNIFYLFAFHSICSKETFERYWERWLDALGCWNFWGASLKTYRSFKKMMLLFVKYRQLITNVI